jgi:hypothetical protein
LKFWGGKLPSGFDDFQFDGIVVLLSVLSTTSKQITISKHKRYTLPIEVKRNKEKKKQRDNMTKIITFVSLASLMTIANGFSTNINLPKQNQMTTMMRVELAVTEAVSNDFGSAMPATVEDVDPHVTIGVEPDDLAIGIDPVKFLELIGTKEDLKEKFQDDNKSWDTVRVEEETDRFMMDAENVNMYLKYLQDRNDNPQKYRAEALENELSLSNPKTVRINYEFGKRRSSS